MAAEAWHQRSHVDSGTACTWTVTERGDVRLCVCYDECMCVRLWAVALCAKVINCMTQKTAMLLPTALLISVWVWVRVYGQCVHCNTKGESLCAERVVGRSGMRSVCAEEWGRSFGGGAPTRVSGQGQGRAVGCIQARLGNGRPADQIPTPLPWHSASPRRRNGTVPNTAGTTQQFKGMV